MPNIRYPVVSFPMTAWFKKMKVPMKSLKPNHSLRITNVYDVILEEFVIRLSLQSTTNGVMLRIHKFTSKSVQVGIVVGRTTSSAPPTTPVLRGGVEPFVGSVKKDSN